MKTFSLRDVREDLVATVLKDGGIFIYPTETCYGLGCDATNPDAVAKVFALKGRPKQKPCIVLFRDFLQLKQYAFLASEIEAKIISYWPGPLTVVLPVRSDTNISSQLISQTNTIACRISSHPFIQTLFQNFNRPIVSTSANRAGEPNIYTAHEIMDIFSLAHTSPDIFVDAGNLPMALPSTIVEVKNGVIHVLRQGSIQV